VYLYFLFCRERENKLEYVYEFDNLNRQLELMRDANQRLQDTNDGLRTVVDIGALSSPRSSAAASGGGGGGGSVSNRELTNLLMSPEMLRTSSSDADLGTTHYPKRRTQR